MKILNATDGYKVYHAQQIPSTVKSVYGNLTARGDKYFRRIFKKPVETNRWDQHMKNQEIPFSKINNTYVAFGMHQALKEITTKFDEQFFGVPFEEAVATFKDDIMNYIGYEDSLNERLEGLHEYGRLPINVKAVNEGDFVEMNSPCLVVETVEGFAWVFGYLEPVITNMIWKTITNATTALEFYKIAKHYGDLTGTQEASLLFGFHDFSSRGMSGMEDSFRSGVPHLLFFNGTESVGSLGYVNEIYDYNYDAEGFLAGSIKATEHSISTLNIFNNQEIYNDLAESEEKFFLDYITKIYPDGLVGYVADTFDFFGFIYDILPKYKDEIEARNGKVVIRPDSFPNPVKGVLGDTETRFFLTIEDAIEYYQNGRNGIELAPTVRILDEYVTLKLGNDNSVIVASVDGASPEETGTLPKLLKEFGYTINEKGFAELNPKIGLIYGDGFTLEVTNRLFEGLHKMGLATSNIVIGIGSASYNFCTRDTLGIAYKATSFKHKDGQHVDIYKDPKGVNKKSAKGRFSAKSLGNGLWEFKDQQTVESSDQSDLVDIVVDGQLQPIPKFSEIRNRIRRNANNNK